MTVARTVADVLTEHTVFEVECIDRMYLNVYQPKLQYATGIIGYLRERLDMRIASTAPAGQDQRPVHPRGAPVRRDRGHRVGRLRQGRAEGRHHAGTPEGLHR